MSADPEDVEMEPVTSPQPPVKHSPPLAQTTESPSIPHSSPCPISATPMGVDGMDGLPTLGHTPTADVIQAEDNISPVNHSSLSVNTPSHAPANHISADSHTLSSNQMPTASHTQDDTHMPTLGTTPTSEDTPDVTCHTSPPAAHTSSTPPSSKLTPTSASHTPPSTGNSPRLKERATEGSKTLEKKVSVSIYLSPFLHYLFLSSILA